MPNIKNNMNISILSNADLVIGQYVSFVVTLSSEKLILPAKQITIKNISNNIKFDATNVDLVYAAGSLTASAQLGLTVLQEASNASVKDGAAITFEVDTDATAGGNGFQSIKFAGTANEIDINSLALFVEKPYLQTPLKEDNKPPVDNIYTPIYTTLKNKKGKPLVGTPVFITSTQESKMKDFHFKDATNNTEIFSNKFGPNEGLSITSGKDGLVKFFLHPKLSLVTIFDLITIIPNVSGARVGAKNEIYVINYSEPDYMNSIGWPNILGFVSGNLSADTGLQKFVVSVGSYDGASMGDVILFFVNKNYTGQAIPVIDPKNQLDQFSIKLPYSIFERGTSSNFSYTVVKKDGHALYSLPLPLNYIGGVPYEPDPDVSREYEPCIVHTSLGVGPDNILPSGYGMYVNIDAIIKYPGYQYDGLFVEILRSNASDPSSTIKSVPLNITDITLNMYINSDNKNFQKSYNQQIPLNKIGGDGKGNADSIFFHIPYKDIVDVRGTGDISFDYQFYLNEKLEYGVSWNANIETIPDPGYKNNN
ncbi:hypothetical protein ID858_13675 [Xenorhabdus sp. DI]|uniref:hypothetical protein n=1 Tax=Xenorhabdus doucetiae TaxID=351671 RepID=UPI001989BCD9|nr:MULTISPECIES: hypothetical protein [unclassified Xenorhabdus]MBD2785902.1 hypothetical protein [Xenorhabdus sp. 3]MBD2789559.1 hypothetical protein [Xenorhabdus sp. DI]